MILYLNFMNRKILNIALYTITYINWYFLKEDIFKNINEMKSTFFHYKILLLTGDEIFTDGYNIIIIPFALAGIREAFHPSNYLLGLIAAGAVTGNLLGALIAD